MSNISPHQFGAMIGRVNTRGGFTYDPRKRTFVTSGYSVAAHKSAEMAIEHPKVITAQHLEGYIKGSAPIWSQAKGKDRGQEMIGVWRDIEGGKDVADLPKVFPATPTGHTKSRRALILRNEESSYNLHEDKPEWNPWFTGSEHAPPTQHAQNFPEFANVVRKNPAAALNPEQYPEIAAWAESPAGRARTQRAQARRPR